LHGLDVTRREDDRMMLPDGHPDQYDMHSTIAVEAFMLRVPNEDAAAKLSVKYGRLIKAGDDCPATKDGLEICGYKALRVAAKNVVFGYAYGRGAEAIQRQCKEEGADVSLEQSQALIDRLKKMYPGLPVYFEGCGDRVLDPGWICSAGGFLRRVRAGAADRKVLGELRRQFMNLGIQSWVAYAISRACDHLVQYRHAHPEVSYRIVLAIHDALLLEVPTEWAEHVHDVVLPECMRNRIPLWPTDFDGYPLQIIKEPYYLDIDIETMERWSEKLSVQRCRELGLPDRFGKGH
jgi:hypothetical protein